MAIKDNRNQYREPDFEFDGIVESKGVLGHDAERLWFLKIK